MSLAIRDPAEYYPSTGNEADSFNADAAYSTICPDTPASNRSTSIDIRVLVGQHVNSGPFIRIYLVGINLIITTAAIHYPSTHIITTHESAVSNPADTGPYARVWKHVPAIAEETETQARLLGAE